MPALFGYLVALVLLLGGGYAGLHWLASPDDVSIHRRIGEKQTARNVPKKTEQSEQSEFNGGRTAAVPGEADAASGIGTTASAPAAMAAPQQSDHEASETEAVAKSGDPASGVNNDNAAAGGCMPIGVTARGADVFPIQCQALIERQRGSGPSAVPPQTTAAPAAVQSDIAETPRQSEPRSEPGVKPAKQDKRQAKRQERPQEKRNLRSSRSGLVMMVLRTIEFPDGHREQQLLPIGRSRRMAVEAEDQW